MATESRSYSEFRQGAARDVEIRTGAVHVGLAERTFVTQGIVGLVKLGVDDDRSLLLNRGTLHLEQIDWLSGDGVRSLAHSAELGIDEGLMSEDIARIRGRIRAHGSNAGTLFALAPVPWLRTVFSSAVGKPYSFDGEVRFEPGRFELENARVSAGRLSVRGAHRSRGERRSGAFLVRYGSWSVGAVFDENEVRPRFGVGERWLKRQLGYTVP